MARGDWQNSSWVALSKRKNCKIGISWRYANSEEDAKLNNKDIIQVKPFIVRTGSDQGWAYNNNWYESSYYSYKIGSGSEKKYYFDTRYYYGYWNDDKNKGENPITNNTPYYLKYTSSSSTTAKQSNPFWTRSAPSTSNISGSSIYFEFQVPHKEDGTQDSVVIKFHLDGASSHGNGDVSVSFTPTRIQRGTKIYRYESNGWQKVAQIHYKGESAGEQHYIYKFNGTSWVKYYG